MNSLKVPLIVGVLSATALVGCSPDSALGVLFDPPDCSISDVHRYNAAPGAFAEVDMTVANSGSGGTAIDVNCSVKLKSGNLIVDESGVGIGMLESNEARRVTILFTEIQNHNEYDQAVYYLWWYDAQGGYHDKTVVNP